jgi:hypothetical protein
VLRWRITVRRDGARLFSGALPTLIEWPGVHPADALPPSGVELEGLAVWGLPAALAGMLPPAVTIERDAHAAPISVTLDTPRGRVKLDCLQPEV